MTITEPITMLTDYMLGIGSIVFGVSLLRASTSRKGLLWPIGFLVGAAAAIAGGTFHGFSSYQSEALHKALWDLTMLLIGTSAGFMVSAAFSGPLEHNAENTRWLRAGLLVNVIGIVIQRGGIAVHPSFNHNDLYHCIQTVAFYLFFRGARLTA